MRTAGGEAGGQGHQPPEALWSPDKTDPGELGAPQGVQEWGLAPWDP